jgi:hypothetical protein
VDWLRVVRCFSSARDATAETGIAGRGAGARPGGDRCAQVVNVTKAHPKVGWITVTATGRTAHGTGA